MTKKYTKNDMYDVEQVEKKIQESSATEILYVCARITPISKGKEYPKVVEVKNINVARKQLYGDMLTFDNGWIQIGHIYTAIDKTKAIEMIQKYKKKMARLPSVKKVI